MNRIYGMAVFGSIFWLVINQSNNNDKNMDIPFDNSGLNCAFIHVLHLETNNTITFPLCYTVVPGWIRTQ